jgi:hypothetical protein
MTALRPDTSPDTGLDIGGPARMAPDQTRPGPRAGSGPAPVAPWTARLRPLVRPSAYYLASRLAVVFAALASKWLYPRLNPVSLLGTGWDGGWFTRIAQYGYPHRIINEGSGSRWAYFPGLPAAIRATHAVTGLSYADAGVLTGTILGLTSALAVWLAVREVFGSVIADRSVLLYVFFPASYVLSMTYSEGLFITAAAGCLFALSRRYWITASVLAVVASLTRNFGILLFVCVAVAALPYFMRERKHRPRDRTLRPLVAVAIAPVGFVAWAAYSWHMTGTPLAFLKAEQISGDSHFVWFSAPVHAAASLFRNFHNVSVGADVLGTVAFVFAYVGIAILWRARRRISIPLSWWVFTVGSVLAMASPNAEQALLRYSLVAFPLFAAFAWKLRPTWEGAVVGSLGLMQGALALVIFVTASHLITSTIWP